MDVMSSPHAAPSHHVQSGAKRRKIRKGTHSCWECKRRKMKCIIDPLVNATCNGCRRRGSECVSQEFPEEVSLPMDNPHKMVEGAVRVGTLPAGCDCTASDGRSPPTPSEDGRRADHVIPSPRSMTSEPPRYLAFYISSKHRTVQNAIRQSATDAPASRGRYEELSHFLHESLSSREDIERICKASRQPSVLAHETLTMPYTALHQNGLKPAETLLDIPEPNAHPVLIARYMLQLATFLQHLDPDLHKEIEGLSESPSAIMERIAHLAISLVTTNDEILGSIEGLECVMIESMYQANIGNVRRSWVAIRRAMGIAQLMGLHRSDNRTQYKVLDSKTKYHPQTMWFRIVDLDRYLCLLLGLPQGCLDRSMVSETSLADDTPMGRLERTHCVLASRILERNESSPSSNDLTLTRNLDMELQRAARSLPSKWWLPPNLAIASIDSQTLFWETRRLFGQIIHYNLLNQLHLPFMLRSSLAERKYKYSRITCVNASREMLSRFVTLRNFNRVAYSCRTVDFLALMAAMTLLLAHLDSHHSEAENLLAHQYLSDRAMIEQAQENMKELNRVNSDTLSAQCADLLLRLLTLDAETADGYPRVAGRVSVQESGTETVLPDQDDAAAVSVHIPYFGFIKIAREGMSKDVSKTQATAARNSRPAQPQVLDRSNTASTEKLHAESQMSSSGLGMHGVMPNAIMPPVDAGYNYVQRPSMTPQEVLSTYEETPARPVECATPAIDANHNATSFAPQTQNALPVALLQYEQYPGLAAGAEDWAFQGVDMAFFDSLMRSAGNEENEDTDWTTVADLSMSTSK